MRQRWPTLTVLFVLALAACRPALDGEVIANPATAPVAVDPAEAARLLSDIRAAEGLGPVRVSPALNAIAADYALVLASSGVVDHNIGGRLRGRLDAAGYQWREAGENLGGGYRSLEEAFANWQASPGHNANLLAANVTEMGIATAFNADSPYRTFWVLLVALPEPPL